MIKTGEFFVCSVTYEKLTEDGIQKKVTEQHVVEAVSFTDAEAKITKDVSLYVSGEFVVKDISRAPYKELILSEKEDDDRFYKVKVKFFVIDEHTAKEKPTNIFYLVQANTTKQAQKYTEQAFEGTMVCNEIASIVETKIIDIL